MNTPTGVSGLIVSDAEQVIPIYTHPYVDVDAAFSCAAYEYFVIFPNNERAKFCIIPMGSNGSDIPENAVILDTRIGGRGIKGDIDEDGAVHSCFAAVVNEYASEEDKKLISPLVKLIDIGDSHGSVVRKLLYDKPYETQEIFDRTGLHINLSLARRKYGGDDLKIIQEMCEYFNLWMQDAYSRVKTEKYADEAEILTGGRVAIVRNKNKIGVDGVLMQRGIKAVVYIDGFNIGVVRSSSIEHIRMDHEKIRDVVREAGEFIRAEGGANFWFPHPSGFLFAHGTRKMPATKPSKVDPRKLAEAVDTLISETDGAIHRIGRLFGARSL